MPKPRLLFAAAVFAGLLFLIWLRLHQPPNTVDDAYITFRYARNLATGVGFVYNPGDHVLGTTTPAYAVLLAALSRLNGFYDYPHLALIVNALCDAITFCLLARMVTRLIGLRWVGLGAAMLFAIDGRTLDFSTGGMETSFNVMAVVLTLTLFFGGRTLWAALAAGLAVLIRPDGATLAAVLFAAWSLDSLRQARFHLAWWPWKEAALFAAVVAPWLIFATLYFGNPIPQSILAKAELYRTPELMAFRAFLVQLRTVFPFSLPSLHDPEPLERQLLQAILPTALCLLGLVILQRRHKQAWVIGAYAALFIAFFSLGNPLWLGWYEVPLMPLYWTLILAAVVWIGERIPSFIFRPSTLHPSPSTLHREASLWDASRVTPHVSRLTLPLAAVVIMALPHLSRLNALPWEPRERDPLVLNPAFNKRREEDYELLARMLLPAAQNDRLVAIPEIGAFGYVYPGRLFDTSGLISPPVLKYFPIPDEIPVEIYSVPRPMIFELRPDLFITFDSFIQATLAPDDPEFLALYRPTLGITSHAAFGIQRLIAYRRSDLPVEAAIPPEAAPVSARFGPDIVVLEGYSAKFWTDGENDFLQVNLFWRNADAPVARDLLVRVNLLDAGGQPIYSILDQPGEKLFPSQSWTPGMKLVDRYELKRPVPDAGPYTVTVTLFDSSENDPLPAASEGAPLADGTLAIAPIPAP